MSEASYSYGPNTYDISQIISDIKAANLPAPLYINGSGYKGPNTPATSIDIVLSNPLTTQQKLTLDSIIANHIPTPITGIKDDAEALTKVAKLTKDSKQKLQDLAIADLYAGSERANVHTLHIPCSLVQLLLLHLLLYDLFGDSVLLLHYVDCIRGLLPHL